MRSFAIIAGGYPILLMIQVHIDKWFCWRLAEAFGKEHK